MVAGLMMAGLTLAYGLADSPQASWADKLSRAYLKSIYQNPFLIRYEGGFGVEKTGGGSSIQ